MGRKRLGEVLLETGAIDIAGLERALEHARRRGLRLGEALRELDLVSGDCLAAALATALGLPWADLRADDLDWTALHLLRPEFCEAHSLLPYAFEEERGHRFLRVAMADPLDVPALDEIEFTTGLRVLPAVASPEAVGEALVRWLRRERPPATALPSPRRAIERDLAFLTGTSETAGDGRLRRLEARTEGLIRLLVERGILGEEELRRLEG
jgi:hypothetical protein